MLKLDLVPKPLSEVFFSFFFFFFSGDEAAYSAAVRRRLFALLCQPENQF